MNLDNNPKPDNINLLERKILYSKIALMVERVWVTIWPPLGIAGTFILLSLTGIWPNMPAWSHKLLLALFCLLFIISFVPMLMCRWPSRKEALKRLEQATGLKHNPVSSYEDSLSAKTPSRTTHLLWLAHKKRLAETFKKLKFGRPRPRVDKLDPYALRALLAIVLAVSLLATGGLVTERLTSAFKISGAITTTSLRLDAWVSPPPYTRKAAIILHDGAKTITKGEEERRFIHVPQNSKLIIRMNNKRGTYYTVMKSDSTPYKSDQKTNYTELSADTQEQTKKPSVKTFTIKLASSTSILVKDGARDVHSWQIFVQKDLPPQVRLLKPVAKTARDSMHLTYHLSDDYGVTSAKANISRKTRTFPSIILNPDTPLGKPPEFSLEIPGRNDKNTKSTYKDLTAHPWAGLQASLVLSAKDAAGQETRTKPIIITIPARKFTKPLAIALIEQRKKLVSKPNSNYFRVKHALHGLSLFPEKFTPSLKVYLGIRTAYWRMEHNRSRETAASVVDQLWELALHIEDGDIADAERQMKLAQDNLAKALRDGASGEEIRKQLQALRSALARFLQAMARNNQSNSSQQRTLRGPGSRNAVTADQLDKMLRQIEQMAKSGSRAQAAQMLNNLRNILENLQASSPQGDNSSEQMMTALDTLNNITSRQQNLHDDAFSQKQNSPESTGENQQDFQQKNNKLADRQNQIQKLLNDLIQKMKKQGLSPEQSLDQAEQAMKEAGKALGEGNLGRATQQQALALDKLRKGAKGIAKRLMQQIGQGPGQAPGQRDPFGRLPSASNRPDFGNNNVKIPDQFDIRRAREILKELRDRFGETNRPPIELDYLERLLERF